MKLTMNVHKVYTSEDLKQIENIKLFYNTGFSLKDKFVLEEVINKNINEMNIIVSARDIIFLTNKVNQISELEFELNLEFTCNA